MLYPQRPVLSRLRERITFLQSGGSQNKSLDLGKAPVLTDVVTNDAGLALG
jgi:hypothetical protein